MAFNGWPGYVSPLNYGGYGGGIPGSWPRGLQGSSRQQWQAEYDPYYPHEHEMQLGVPVRYGRYLQYSPPTEDSKPFRDMIEAYEIDEASQAKMVEVINHRQPYYRVYRSPADIIRTLWAHEDRWRGDADKVRRLRKLNKFLKEYAESNKYARIDAADVLLGLWDDWDQVFYGGMISEGIHRHFAEDMQVVRGGTTSHTQENVRASLWIGVDCQNAKSQGRHFDMPSDNLFMLIETVLHEAAHAYQLTYMCPQQVQMLQRQDMHSSWGPLGSQDPCGAVGGHGRVFLSILSVVGRIILKEIEKGEYWDLMNLTDSNTYQLDLNIDGNYPARKALQNPKPAYAKMILTCGSSTREEVKDAQNSINGNPGQYDIRKSTQAVPFTKLELKLTAQRTCQSQSIDAKNKLKRTPNSASFPV